VNGLWIVTVWTPPNASATGGKTACPNSSTAYLDSVHTEDDQRACVAGGVNLLMFVKV
jgi:hypothetical protein